MEGNAFSLLVQSLREDTDGRIAPSFRIGKVVSESPFTINISGVLHDKSVLAFTTSLPYPEYLEVEVDSTELRYDVLPAGYDQHSHSGITQSHKHSARVKNWLSRYEKGTKLLLIPIEDEQRYIVLARLYDY